MKILLQNRSYGIGDNFLKSKLQIGSSKNPTLKVLRVSVLISH